MCLRFVFLLITRVTTWLRLSRREEAWLTAEILILRHQLAVLQRRQPNRPNVNWADRALLATLLSVIPKAQHLAPRRSALAWSQFLPAQTEAILACDFFTADLPDGTQAHVLAVIEHATRRTRILGVTLHPTGQWTAQQARNLIMDLGEQAHRAKFLIRDRDSKFTAVFDDVFAGNGVRIIKTPIRSPRPNSFAERFAGNTTARVPGSPPDLR
jgi:hypothetical protein